MAAVGAVGKVAGRVDWGFVPAEDDMHLGHPSVK